MDPMNMTLDSQSFWSSGSLDHFMRQAVPLLVFAALMFLCANAAKRGLRIFQRPDPSATEGTVATSEEPTATAKAAEEDEDAGLGRPAMAFAGFDPDIYGKPPSREDEPDAVEAAGTDEGAG